LPCPSTGTLTTRSRPKPARPSAFSRLTCTSSPTTTVTGGAPNNPCPSTFHPTFPSTAWRAATSELKLAVVAAVTNAPPQPGGSLSTSSSQRSAISRSEEHTSELQSRGHLVCRLLLEKKK